MNLFNVFQTDWTSKADLRDPKQTDRFRKIQRNTSILSPSEKFILQFNVDLVNRAETYKWLRRARICT